MAGCRPSTLGVELRTGLSAARADPFRRTAKVIWWALTLQLPRRLRERQEARRHAEHARKSPDELYEEWVREFDTLTESDMEGMSALCQSLARRPLVSVLMPVFDPWEGHLRATIESVLNQVYPEWELCIADCSTTGAVGRVLEEYERSDDRIRVIRRPGEDAAWAASNATLEAAQGELAAPLAHDDILRPHSLLLSVHAVNADPGVGLVYSDEDRIDEEVNAPATTSSPTGTQLCSFVRITRAAWPSCGPRSCGRSAVFAPGTTRRRTGTWCCGYPTPGP